MNTISQEDMWYFEDYWEHMITFETKRAKECHFKTGQAILGPDSISH